jgi:hypothetical protein
MCYSTRSSFIAWFIAVGIAIYLYNRNKNYDRWNAMFIFTFTLIQLLEGLLWSTSSQKLNNILTIFVLIVLLLQPLVQSKAGADATNNKWLEMMIYLYVIVLLYGLFYIYRYGKNFYTSVGESGHLVWHFEHRPFEDIPRAKFPARGKFQVDSQCESDNILKGPIGLLYLMGLFIPLLFAGWKGLPLLLTGIFTAIYSLRIAGKDEFSSLWCYYSVIYAVIAIFV